MPRSLPLGVALALALAVSVALWLRSGERDSSPEAAPEAAAAHASPTAATLEPASPVATEDPPARREAAPIGADAVPESGADAPAVESSAVLVALVVGETGGEPLAGVRVLVQSRASTRGSCSHVEGSRGTLTTSPVTGADGRAEFELPAGVELVLRGGDGNEQGRGEVEVAALGAGERREVVLALATSRDEAYFGRVVAAEDEQPLAGARVELLLARESWVSVDGGESETQHSETRLADVETGADGLFELSIASWSGPIARVTAAGFTPAYVELARGHESPEKARRVPLRRAASLVARLVDARGAPVTGALVRLGTPAHSLGLSDHGAPFLLQLPDPRWEVAADASGACAFEDLPSEVPLRVEVVVAGRSASAGISELALAPGETREVEWRVAGGCALEGRVVDQHGEPVPRLQLWLMPALHDSETYFQPNYLDEPRTAATTRHDGRFLFSDVLPGKWWLGPAPVREDWEPAQADGTAPLAQVVDVPDGRPSLELELRVQRGLYVRGRVLDPAGEPAPEAFVWGDGVLGPVTSRSAGDGTFALGPLGRGLHTLTASSMAFADSEPVEAHAGEEGVELRLKAAGSVRGTVIDEQTGERCPAEIAVSLVDDAQDWLMTSTKPDGSFAVDGLKPGTYQVTARASSTRVGVVGGIHVTAGSRLEIVVPARAGATLRLENPSSKPLVYRVECGGATITFDGISAGGTSEAVVPAARLVVEFGGPGEEARRLEVVLAPGEHKELALGVDGG